MKRRIVISDPFLFQSFNLQENPWSEFTETTLHYLKKTVLLLGEGDFTYALAYARRHPNYKVVATEYYEKPKLIEKYGEKFRQNLEALKQYPNVKIYYCLDATKLNAYRNFSKKMFDKIVFNGPETGTRDSGTAGLLHCLFKSARNILKKNGTIRLALVDGVHYDGRYFLTGAARPNRYKLIKRKTFDQHKYYYSYDYKHMQTASGVEVAQEDWLNCVFRKVDSHDKSFDSSDEFTHSSDLSQDDGRIDRLASVKRRLGHEKGKVNLCERSQYQIQKRFGSEVERLAELGILYTCASALASKEAKKFIEQKEYKKAERIYRTLTRAYPGNESYSKYFDMLRQMRYTPTT
ncbi:MAG: DUF2431 domain-containing protein [Chlamydiae bacterium]|nr:DUF2431 domain-containing protein [Chlamydiota bacterium]